MVVQHNMQALNANRMLGITSGLQAKSTEKLASGYQINRAADDAAGLSISEKMRKQIKGLDQAATNAQDGISSVQTAEGALTEVHSMLQRMNELAVQAANGTNSETDRQSIQDEIDQLTTEIDRVAETTKFNETYLLKGNGKSTTVNIDAKDAGIAGELTGVGTGNATFKMDELKTGEQITIGSKGYTIGSSVDTIKGIVADTSKVADGSKITINSTTYTVTDGTEDPTENVLSRTEIQKRISDGDKVVIGSETHVAMTDGTPSTAAEVKAAVTAAATVGDTITIGGQAYTVTASGDSTIKDGLKDAKAAITAAIAAWTTGTTATITIDGQAFTGGNMDGIATALDNLDRGQKINIGGGDVTIGEAGGAYEDDFVADIEKIASLIEDDSVVSFEEDGTAKEVTTGTTILNNDGVGDNDASVITADKAYELIAKELAAAGSIGADAGSEASIITVDDTGVADPDEDNLFYKNGGKVTFQIKEGQVQTTQGLQFTLHVGADADENNKIALTIDSMDSTSLGVSGINVVDNTGAKATYAIDSIADAIAKVSAQRSALGAVQNRLEHTIANLDNVVENTTSAESSIRDTDMAAEMVNYSKNNILAQAGQAMLAQANTSTQGVLSLLG